MFLMLVFRLHHVSEGRYECGPHITANPDWYEIVQANTVAMSWLCNSHVMPRHYHFTLPSSSATSYLLSAHSSAMFRWEAINTGDSSIAEDLFTYLQYHEIKTCFVTWMHRSWTWTLQASTLCHTVKKLDIHTWSWWNAVETPQGRLQNTEET